MNERVRSNQLVKHLDFIILDFLMLELSYFLARMLYHGDAAFAEPHAGRVLYQGAFLAFSLLLTILIGTPYSKILRRNVWTELRMMVQHTVSIAVLNVLMLFFFHEAWWMSRAVVIYTFLLYFILGMATRIVWKRILRYFLLKDGSIQSNSLIVVCSSRRAQKSIEMLQSDVYRTYKINGIFLVDYDEEIHKGMVVKGVPVLGSSEEALNYTTHHWVDEVILNLRHHMKLAETLESHFEAMGITSHMVIARLTDEDDRNIPKVERYGSFIVTTHTYRDVPLIQSILKRTLDIAGAIVGLLITGLITLIIGPMIYKADPGPIFYTASRVGKNGRMFKMYKFRSMYQDADERKAELMSQNKMKGFMFKMDDDPRIIGSEKKDKNGKPRGIGNFIRKTSLDEFPQFLNVLKGDMSLVGTRPPTTDEWIQYSERHRIRLSMRPGITGMWQVSGRSDITDFEEVVRLDEEYIETWTVAKDLKILFLTVFQVLQHKGAE